jgi:HEAT repeat protein
MCARLASIARLTNDPDESRAAVKKLSYVKDPIAIESLQRVIERRKTLEMLDVEEVAIRALARMGTKEAREALVSVRSHTRLVTMREIDQFLQATSKPK